MSLDARAAELGSLSTGRPVLRRRVRGGAQSEEPSRAPAGAEFYLRGMFAAVCWGAVFRETPESPSN